MINKKQGEEIDSMECNLLNLVKSNDEIMKLSEKFIANYNANYLSIMKNPLV